MTDTNRNAKEVVTIDPNNQDSWPYYYCPKCGMGNITRAFNRCVDCGCKIKWEQQ
jgi:uncharacterized protein (DUF983 family)